MSYDVHVKGIVYNNKAPEIKLDDIKDFNDLRTNIKDRSPVVYHKSQTTETRIFIADGVVYRIEQPISEK